MSTFGSLAASRLPTPVYVVYGGEASRSTMRASWIGPYLATTRATKRPSCGDPATPVTARRRPARCFGGAGVDRALDIKDVWELSRFGCTFVLARAFVLTEDPTYAQAWWTAVEDWLPAASRGALAYPCSPTTRAPRRPGPPCWLGFSEKRFAGCDRRWDTRCPSPTTTPCPTAALAQQPAYPVDVSLVLSPSTVAPDGTFTATLNGCSTGEVATFTVTGDSATDTSASPATATLTAPAAPGSYAVTGAPPRCRQARRSRSQRPELVHPARARADYATTSSDSVPLAQIGSGVLLAGIGLVAVARYRRWSVSAT